MRKYKKNILYLLTAFALVFSMLFITFNYAGAVENTEDTITTENEAASDKPISDKISTDEAEKNVVDEPIEEESSEEEATKDFNFGEDTYFADEEASYPEDEELYPGEEDENGIIWYSRTEAETAEFLGVELPNEGIALLANSSSVITGSTYTDYGCASVRIRVGGNVAFCVIPWSKVPNGVSANFVDINITGTSSDNSNHQLLSKLIYYGYGGGGDLGYGETITHFALSKVWYDMGYTYNTGLSWTYTGGSYLNSEGQAKVTEFINKVQNLTNVKGTLRVAQLYASGETYQDVIYGDFESITPDSRALKITIHKLDEKGKPLSGAEFTVYGYNKATKAYTTFIETKTSDSDGEIVFSSLTDSNGNAYTGNGLFLVKETKVPDGYKISENYLNDADKADFQNYGGRLYYVKGTGGDCVAYRDTEAITVISEYTRASTGITIRVVLDHTGYLVSDVYDTDQYSSVKTCWWSDAKGQTWYDNTRKCRSGHGGWYRSVVSADDLLTYSSSVYTFSNLNAHTYANNNTLFIGSVGGSVSAYKYGGDGNADWSYTTSDGRAKLSIYNIRIGGNYSYLFRVHNLSSKTLTISAPTWTYDGNQSDIKWLGGSIAAGGYKSYSAPDGDFDNLALLTTHFYIDGSFISSTAVHTQEYLDGIFTNEKTHAITLKKEIKGNMADITGRWDFTVNITGNPGESFTVIQNESVSTTTIPSDATSTDIHVTLANNESVLIQGLTDRNIYTISEDNANTDGYTTTSDGTVCGKASDNTVTFVNTKESIVPTGINDTDTLPAIILIMAICASGVVLAAKFSKRH